MENINSFISKKIITLDGEKIGYILNGIFDSELKLFQGFLIVDEESEEEFLIESSDIISAKNDCVVIENAKVLKPVILMDACKPIGKQVYNCDGVFLGIIKDVLLENKSVKKVITDKGEIMPKVISKVGNFCVIVGKKRKAKRSLIFPKVMESNEKTVIMPMPSKTTLSSTPQKPARAIGNINIVLGRTVKEDVLGLNNEIIARKGEKINKKILNRALNHGKSNLLLFLSE